MPHAFHTVPNMLRFEHGGITIGLVSPEVSGCGEYVSYAVARRDAILSTVPFVGNDMNFILPEQNCGTVDDEIGYFANYGGLGEMMECCGGSIAHLGALIDSGWKGKGA